MIILDTNVISEVAKPNSSPSILAWLDRQAEDALYLTTVTIAEISAGIQQGFTSWTHAKVVWVLSAD